MSDYPFDHIITKLRTTRGSAFALNVMSEAADEIERLQAKVDRAEAALQRVQDLHPKVENPRHGCCAEPKLCDGHGPECRSPEHPLGGVRWPCGTLRAIEEGPS